MSSNRDTKIFAYLRDRDLWQFASAHRHRFADHREARESDAPGQLVEYFDGSDELEAVGESTGEAEIVDAAEESRYELWLRRRLLGLAAYRRRNGRIVFTHTEVDESCEGRGFGASASLHRQGECIEAADRVAAVSEVEQR